MDVRALIRIAGPLALTFTLVGAEAFGASAPVRWTLVLAVTLAWTVHAWSLLHVRARLLGEQVRVFGELRHFIGVEVQGSRTEIERARKLIAESAHKLGRSLETINRSSRHQTAIVAGVIGHRDGSADHAGVVDRFALQASAQVRQCATALEAVSEQSGTVVSHLDTMACHLDGIFSMLADMQTIADQGALLARNAANEAARAGDQAGSGAAATCADVRNLSDRMSAFNEQLCKRARTSKDSITHVRAIVRQMAARDFDRGHAARDQAAALLERVDGLRSGLATGMREMSECDRSIAGSVAAAMRLLQFDDIASQSLSAAEAHLLRLDSINAEATMLQALVHRSSHAGSADMRHAVGRLGEHVARMRDQWERPPHKPARQQSMDAGSVELF